MPNVLDAMESVVTAVRRLQWPFHPWRGHNPTCPTSKQECRYGSSGSCARCPYLHRLMGFPLEAQRG